MVLQHPGLLFSYLTNRLSDNIQILGIFFFWKRPGLGFLFGSRTGCVSGRACLPSAWGGCLESTLGVNYHLGREDLGISAARGGTLHHQRGFRSRGNLDLSNQILPSVSTLDSGSGYWFQTFSCSLTPSKWTMWHPSLFICGSCLWTLPTRRRPWKTTLMLPTLPGLWVTQTPDFILCSAPITPNCTPPCWQLLGSTWGHILPFLGSSHCHHLHYVPSAYSLSSTSGLCLSHLNARNGAVHRPVLKEDPWSLGLDNWLQIPALEFVGCETMNRFLNHSVP